MTFLARYEPYLRSLARIMIGFTFCLNGVQKFFGLFGGIGGHSVPATSMLGWAGVLETFGGACILLGLFTQPVAFLLAGEMCIGYFRAHNPQGFWPMNSPGALLYPGAPHAYWTLSNNGELAVLYSFFFLWLSSSGAGPWSLDRLLKRKT
jgi:putative oxidoreductase